MTQQITTNQEAKTVAKRLCKRLMIAAFQIACVVYICHCVIETVPQDKYRVIKGINSVTKEWLDAAKEKRNRSELVQLAKNNMPAMPASELALPNSKSVESLR